MSTTANKTSFEHMQNALIKLRFAVETVIMGSYVIPTEDITKKKLQDTYINEDPNTVQKNLSEVFLPEFLKNINNDLKSIYQNHLLIRIGGCRTKVLVILLILLIKPLKYQVKTHYYTIKTRFSTCQLLTTDQN
jgi:type IV secretory pathway component VirB8